MSEVIDFERVRVKREEKELDEDALIQEVRAALADLRALGKVPKSALLLVFDGEEDVYVTVYKHARILPALVVGALEMAKMRLMLKDELGELDE